MSEPFHFKQFTINQRYAPMKVGTDGVLLGAWCDCEAAKTALDIGTGTGVIALMLAQRNSKLHVTAIEPNDLALRDAAPNFENSKWSDRLVLHKANIQSFKPSGKFDLIVSNPPFFKNALQAPDQDRSMARHISDFGPLEFAKAALKFLNPNGIIAGIYPIETFSEFEKAAADLKLFPVELCSVRPAKHKPPHRILFAYSLTKGQTTYVSELLIEADGRHNYSDDYKNLTSNFYLKF